MTLTAKIHRVFDDGKVKAIASVNIGDDFAVHGVKVLTGENGDVVVMPSTKYKDRYQDTFHPINREAREQITGIVLDAYAQYLSQGTLPSQKPPPQQSEPQDIAQAL
ncbi:MAG: SpoVG family protein [Candidatus Izemoplasmatales bacterium]